MAETLWGAGGGKESKPSWLNDDDKERTFATNAGWVMKHPDGNEELLVAISNLKSRLGAASITEVLFAKGTYTAAGTKTIRVTYNEAVTVTGSPTLSLTAAGASTTPVVATYSSTSDKTLVFSFTVPVAGTTLTLAAQSIDLAGGTIVETGVTPTVNAEVAISATVAASAGTKLTV